MFRFSERNRSRTTWLMCLVLVLGMALQSASAAVRPIPTGAPAGELEWVEVCSVAGMQWVSLKTGQVLHEPPPGQESSKPASMLDCCGCCGSSRDWLALPAPELPALALTSTPAVQIVVRPQPVKRQQAAWHRPPTRAPPLRPRS